MQNRDIKISVIMPAYNVADYIKKSVESVLMQEFKDFELILVDDGSIDNTPVICDEFKKKDDRVIVIHQKNSGAHIARNNAIKIAKGKYVCFFDSDDYIEKNTLKDMYYLAEENNTDLVISGFYIDTYYDDKNFVKLDYIPITDNDSEIQNFYDKNEFRKNIYKNFDKNMFYPPWNKLYKLSYLKENNITFPITYRDDFPFILKVIRDIEKVTYTKKQYYNFVRKRSDSETQKYVSSLYEKREEEHLLMIELFTYWGLIDDKNSIEMISRRYIDRIIECMVNLFNSKCELKNADKLREIKKYLDNENLKKSIHFAKPKKLYLKIMYIPIILKSKILCFVMSKFISTVKRYNIKMFSLLKTNR